MRRLRPVSSVAVLLLAATCGCASFAPGAAPAPDPAPAATTAAGPATIAVADPTPEPKAAPAAATAPRQAAPRAAARSGPAATGAKSGASSEPRARASAPSTDGGAAAPTARGEPSASTGPTVSTFVFSDAPAPVRREAARGEAASAPNATRMPEGFNPYRIAYAPGTYRCELGRSVQVRTVATDLRSTVLRWGEGDYTLRSVDARSGALRYEDPAAGLAWIVLKDRAMLLDTRAGQRLANACRAQGAGGRDGA